MSDIIEKSKKIAEYLGWEYIPFNDLKGLNKPGWYSNEGKYYFICRKHNELRFYNSFDALIPVIEKIENEELGQYGYSWKDPDGEIRYNIQGIDFDRWRGESCFVLSLELDPGHTISSKSGEGIIKDTFNAIIETIDFINELKNGISN